jgi:thiol-disulfide isomerase/thioredoxin
MRRHFAATPARWLLAAAALLAGPAALASGDAVGQPAPALVVKDLDGRALDLKELRGSVVVLNVWATWCPPCRAEMPMLEAFQRKFAPRGVIVLGVSADDVHDRKDVVRAMRGFSYRAALLGEASSNALGMPTALPISYVIDAAGVIRARLPPGREPLTEDKLAAIVAPLLAPEQAATP